MRCVVVAMPDGGIICMCVCVYGVQLLAAGPICKTQIFEEMSKIMSME